MRRPIHVQAERMGLVPPVGCSAGVIRDLGYDVPESVLDVELYVRDESVLGIASEFESPTTGYVWQMPPGRFELVLQPVPRFMYIPDWGVAVVYSSEPTDEELKRAIEIPEGWYYARDLSLAFYDQAIDLIEEIRETEGSSIPPRKPLALRTGNG